MPQISRTLGMLAAPVLALALPHGAAVAQGAASSRQMTFIVGFAPGGLADTAARLVANKLSETGARKVIVENRPGAGANIAARAVITSPPDGSTILATTAALAINETLYKNKGFSAETSLAPVAIVATSPEVFSVGGRSDYKDLADFVAKDRNPEIAFATAGIGTSSHIAGEYFFKKVLGLSARNVPFRGGADAVNAVVGGHAPMIVGSLSGVVAQIQGNELKGLAIAHDKRAPTLPSVPTFEELGYKGMALGSWIGFFAPVATPQVEIAALNRDIADAVADKTIVSRLAALGFEMRPTDLKENTEFLKNEFATWGKMVRELELSME